ncbi:MAG: mechanosensitive ion channel family protein [bacterium]
MNIDLFRDLMPEHADVLLNSFGEKSKHILLIILIVILSRLFVFLLYRLSHFIVYCESWPLGLVYKYNKERKMTIHSIVLNLLKYVIYFTCIGFILSELGVNYKAYLASLSVIGLAVGFGSQGLVQDVVTGFFIVFEGQFDVGNMVEISGQTGIIEELGLRMTRIRTYTGQIVVIPNRNIALVSTYKKGALETFVHIHMSKETDVEKSSNLIEIFNSDFTEQYKGIIMKKPEIVMPHKFKSGEIIFRLHTMIWPQQQWVIEQQFIPRIREILKKEEIDIFNDRVVVFYHAPE